jgi:serine/threonine-protein kinase HipA
MPPGRKSNARALSIWSNGERVGLWRLPARGTMELAYDTTWVQSPAGRPLSLSLPFTLGNTPLKGETVQNWFDNLLPDSRDIRKRLAGRFHTRSTDAFDLLQAIGRDCVGAVQLLAEDESPVGYDRIEGAPLTDAQIEEHLHRVTALPAPGRQEAQADDWRISIAGAQEKTALLWHRGRWRRPHGSTPSTHIFKLPLGLLGPKKVDFTTSVQNEWVCLRLLSAFGLPSANAQVMRFGALNVLCVERFDRKLHSSRKWLLRLPQEDFCQARGLPPDRKYEAEGGPGVLSIAEMLRRSVAAAEDLRTLLSAQILFWLLAAPDGHAKNFSIRLLPESRFQLTPLYDVMSIWPTEGDGPNQWSWHKAKLAMSVEGKTKHYRFRDVQRRHFNAMAARCGHGRDAEDIIEELLARVEPAIATVAAEVPPEFPAQVPEKIFAGLRWSAQALAGMDKS